MSSDNVWMAESSSSSFMHPHSKVKGLGLEYDTKIVKSPHGSTIVGPITEKLGDCGLSGGEIDATDDEKAEIRFREESTPVMSANSLLDPGTTYAPVPRYTLRT